MRQFSSPLSSLSWNLHIPSLFVIGHFNIQFQALKKESTFWTGKDHLPINSCHREQDGCILGMWLLSHASL